MGQLLQRHAVVREALPWLGTPYHHHGRIRGAGVDCAMLLAEVYERCGLAPHVEPGHYPVDWHLHHSEELFMGWLERAGAHAVAAPALGDLGLWRFGRAYSHGGIVVSTDGPAPQIVHSYLQRGVILTRTDEDPLSGRLVRWFTLWPQTPAKATQ